ncbi:MAG: hypothetical protein KME16_10325 [Scytolyngbya sp. HA4215-MV1]|jgi:hypothetical protein|nr:hypothetical protein [Scytolyngbya sp. HA4215-MV1]
MSFSQYQNLGETIQAFQIRYTEANFIQEVAFPISDYFRQDWDLMLEEGVVDNSEFAICQNLIYPVLKEVWKAYRSKFLLWTQKFFNYNASLSGFPEYILARRSPLGKVVFDKPYFILVEAKQDNFDAGWGQCLAEMIAAQQLNGELNITVYGIVSNGDVWQFGKLEDSIFTHNKTFYTIQALEQLFSAVNYLFQQCEIQLDQKIPLSI